jgi:cytochrome c-type biogenesis protein CcmH
LRVLVRERLKAGDTDQQVLDFLVARYGEFVLLKPPLSWHTVALWGLPPAVLFIGAGVIIADLRRRRLNSIDEEASKLSAAEESRLAELLRDNSAS